MVLSAMQCMQALHLEEARFDGSSTDSNRPMNLPIPAITIGGGGEPRGAHSPDESIDITDSYLGSQLAFVLVLSLLQ